MLIYHFGSREGLLIEVIRTVEAQQRAALAAMLLDEDATPAEIMRRTWQPRRRPGAVAERAPVLRDLHPGAPGPPRTPCRCSTASSTSGSSRSRGSRSPQGRDEAEARAEARLGRRGHARPAARPARDRDRAAVDAAMERYIAAIAPDDEDAGAHAHRRRAQPRLDAASALHSVAGP